MDMFKDHPNPSVLGYIALEKADEALDELHEEKYLLEFAIQAAEAQEDPEAVRQIEDLLDEVTSKIRRLSDLADDTRAITITFALRN